jgi:hypothetical protein
MEQYDRLGGRVVKYVERFEEWAVGYEPVRLEPCLCGIYAIQERKVAA